MQNIIYLLKYPHFHQIGKSHYVWVPAFPVAIVHLQQQTLGQAATIPQKTKEVKKRDQNVLLCK